METNATGLQKIQTAFNDLLLRHLSRLGLDEKRESPPLERIETLTLIYLLHESENEIGSGGAPPVRGCSRKALLADLADIDPQGGITAASTLDQLIAGGLVAENGEQEVKLTAKAVEMVALYDAAFPGMPGLSFVAYLLQTIQEVSSGRKTLTAALGQVDRTLRLQGRTRGPEGAIVAQGETGGSAENRPQTAARLNRLCRLREAAAGAAPQPRIVTRSGCAAQVAVKTLFPRKNSGPLDEKSAAAEPGIRAPEAPKVQGAAKPEQLHPGGGPLTPVASGPGDLPAGGEGEGRLLHRGGSGEPDGAGLAAGGTTAAVGDPPAGEPPEPDKDHPPTGGTTHAPQAGIPRPVSRRTGVEDAAFGEPAVEAAAPEPERAAGDRKGAGQPPEFNPPASDAVPEAGTFHAESAAIENHQTIRCPICRSGSLQPAVTPKGKIYYACSQAGCSFVSWGKPSPHPCPVCGNPFLVETPIRSQGVGLRCPRATCTFRQAHANPPSPQAPPSRRQPNRAIPVARDFRKVVRKVVRARRPV